MRIARYLVMSLASLPITYLLTGWWLSSWWSERTWTWLNQMFGQDLGLASDVELLLVIACAFSLSFALMSFMFWIVQLTYNTQHRKDLSQMKEVIYASLMGFWILSATYALLWIGNFYGIQVTDWPTSLVFWVNLGVSFIIVLALTLFGWFAWRRIRER